ncbi:MAG TPA: hypothetical protein LFW20_07680 [Rickettsia endosymbiont of Omalisus fontisbellaquei]|nr:hypothetical protein [Rickettsia endosymbiont of Omalisus fontisbellaquei]
MLHVILGFSAFFSTYLGYSLFLRKYLKIEFSHALIFATSIVLSIYFVAAILYVLDPIIYASFAIGIGLFLYSIFDFLKQNKVKDLGDLFTWDIIVFIGAVIIYFLCIKNLIAYAFWDEYSYWGVAIKEMDYYHGLRGPDQAGTVLEVRYTQLATIFQYSISKLLGFKEAYNVFANGLLCIIFSSVALVERKLFWSIILPLIMLIPTLEPSLFSWNSLHLDVVVGIVFSGILATYIQSKKYNNILLSYILLVPMLFILPNIKEVGYWLSYIVILFIFIDQVIDKKYKYLWITIPLIILSIIGRLLWFYYLNTIRVMESDWNTHPLLTQIPFSSIINFLLSNDPDKWNLLRIMIPKLLPYFYSVKILCIYIIIAITIFLLRNYDRRLLKAFKKALLIIFIGFLVYIIFRLHLYITSFMLIEAINVYSYERYLSSYMPVFAFCAISFIKMVIEQKDVKLLSTKILAFFGIILAVFSAYEFKKILRFPNSDPYYFYNRINWINGLIKDGLNENREFKENNFNMLDCYIYRYLEAPTVNQSNVKKCLEHISPEHAEVYVEKLDDRTK